MERIIIFGVGDLANQLYRYLSFDDRYSVAAFTVENNYLKEKEYLGLPVVAFESLETLYSKEDYKMIVCIGYNKMNRVRARVFESVLKKGYEIINYIHPLATVLTKDIGYGNIILENANISIGVKIGNGNLIYNNVVLCHDVQIGNFNSVSASANFLGHSSMGDLCFIGANSTIKDSVFINDLTLVGANAFINKNTKVGSVFVSQKAQKLTVQSEEIII